MESNNPKDLFISYNTNDKLLVDSIVNALDEEGVSVFLDSWDIRPGDDVIEILEQGLEKTLACAVFVGPGGLGPWQSVEIKSAIVQQIESQQYPVIPVILEGGKRADLPKFLNHKNALDYDSDLKKFVNQLSRSIPGRESDGCREKRKFSKQDLETFKNLKPVYNKIMSADWRRLRLEGLDTQASDASADRGMSLDQVYVGLLTTRHKGRKEVDLGSGDDDTPVSVLEAVSGKSSLVVLLGQPGSGKSTFLRYLAFVLLQADQDGDVSNFKNQLPGWTCGPLFPVFLSLPRLVRHIDGAPETGSADLLESLILAEFDDDSDLKGFGLPLLAYLQQHGGLVLMDGLDEVNSRLRVIIKQSIQRFHQLYDRCRMVCTCRTHSYRASADWQLESASEFELAPFSGDQIQAFIERWYKSLSHANPRLKEEYSLKADKLGRALSGNDVRQLNTIANNPLLLTVMAIVHTHYSELPDSRVQVYKACVELLLDRWSVKRSERSDTRSLFDELRECGIKKAKVYQGLRALAYEGLRTGEAKRFGDASRGLVGEPLAAMILQRFLRERGTEIFLQHCKTDNGLLLAQGLVPRDAGEDEDPVTAFSFPHLTFQEYLAACRLCELPENKANRQQLSIELAGDTAWREVIRFQTEYLCFDESENRWMDALDLLRGLVPKNPPVNDQDWRRIVLAGELALTVIQEANDEDLELVPKQRFHGRLVDLLHEPDTLAISPIERALAGRALGGLGDQRPGVTEIDSIRLPKHAWVPVPGTTDVGVVDGFKLGQGAQQDSIKVKIEAWPDETGVEIDAFYMAAYPVTWAQFACFVNAGNAGYCNNDYWTQAGLANRGNSRHPILFNDPKWNLPNHPAVGITWYEAVAYCNWLSDCWKKQYGVREWTIRLPTEAEWEWAARGPEGRLWPWGDKWKNGLCNSSDRGLNRTIAVGSDPLNRNWLAGNNPRWFPTIPKSLNASHELSSIFDLAGNVWEWCATEWAESYQSTVWGRNQWKSEYLESDVHRVLRGCAYWVEKIMVRGGARFRYAPWGANLDWGFRCCASTSSNSASGS